MPLHTATTVAPRLNDQADPVTIHRERTRPLVARWGLAAGRFEAAVFGSSDEL